MPVYAQIQTGALILTPVAASTAPANSLYVDSTSGSLTSKDGTSTPGAIGSSGANYLLKTMQNTSVVDIPALTPVAKKSDGGIVAADANDVAAKVVIGISLVLITAGSQGSVLLAGPNVPGAVAGKGFTPGEAIFMSEIAGGYVPASSLTDLGDKVVMIGYADCAEGAASATCVDLVMVLQTVIAGIA